MPKAWRDLNPVSNTAHSALSEAMASSEYKTMVQCTPKLVAGIAKDPKEIADALFAKGLIAEGVKGEMSLQLTPTDKARKLVENVTSEVKIYPKETFREFLDILRDCGWLKKLVGALEDKLGMFSSSSSNSSSSSSGSRPWPWWKSLTQTTSCSYRHVVTAELNGCAAEDVRRPVQGRHITHLCVGFVSIETHTHHLLYIQKVLVALKE